MKARIHKLHVPWMNVELIWNNVVNLSVILAT